ncbi:MAG: NAD(P)-dependent oxidoreductase, partial [Bacteroidetes bacterium]|nr:NAD(P)-dependent oxidoreductase [Bacteroidota bacterium]
TESLAGAEFFDAMRSGAFFINTTRSSVVDEDAMISAMEEKSIRVALDVFSEEPAYKEGELSHTLAARKDVYLTHHIGASTAQAQEAIADEATRVILTYAASNTVPNCVNIAEKTPATHQLTVRHLDKVGVLASILEEVRLAEWNVQEMENLVFAGAHAACASIRFDGTVRKEVLERIQANSDVLAVSLIDL